jgi:hypothetical protein
MTKINWNRFKPGDVVTFYFHLPTTPSICFQWKTWDAYDVYGTKGEKYSRAQLLQAVEVGIIR